MNVLIITQVALLLTTKNVVTQMVLILATAYQILLRVLLMVYVRVSTLQPKIFARRIFAICTTCSHWWKFYLRIFFSCVGLHTIYGDLYSIDKIFIPRKSLQYKLIIARLGENLSYEIFRLYCIYILVGMLLTEGFYVPCSDGRVCDPPCHRFAMCANTFNGTFGCQCRAGYSGDGISSCEGKYTIKMHIHINHIIITVSQIITYGTLGATSFLLLVAIVITVTVICLRRCYIRRRSYYDKTKDNL